MIRFTTPTHEHKVKGIDLTGCDVYVSYEQGLVSVDVKATEVSYDGSDSTVTVELTQEQSGRFREGKALVQINWVYPDGKRDATVKKDMDVTGNLLSKVVEHGD